MTLLQRRDFLSAVACLSWLHHAPVRTAELAQEFDAATLANYRLTALTFTRFAHATRLIGVVIRDDPRYRENPLITRDISVAGDAPQMASLLQRRLEADPALNAALFAADLGAREYAAFAIALFAARLAHGFVKSGAMRRVPAGVAADNVAFVASREKEINRLMQQLKLE